MTGRATLKPAVSENDHAAGPADAPVTLVEYGDYQCPHCRRAHPRVKSLQKQFGDRMRFVFRNFPLSEMHPDALHAAEAAESVAANSGDAAFWKMHDAIYDHQQDDEDALDDDHLARYAADAGGNGEQVLDDLSEERFVERVRADFMGGVRSGVNGTPTFFINGVRYEGDWTTVATFAADIEAAMP
ncbi:MAG: thioredoxin domain-containing protein [Gemmatimonadaceae bacterium]